MMRGPPAVSNLEINFALFGKVTRPNNNRDFQSLSLKYVQFRKLHFLNCTKSGWPQIKKIQSKRKQFSSSKTLKTGEMNYQKCFCNDKEKNSLFK